MDDDSNGECNLIYKIDHCLNENKKPNDNIQLSPSVSVEFQKYNTYLKNSDIDKYNLNRMNCIILNELVSLKHEKYPFDFVYQNNDGGLIMDKIENTSQDTEKVKTVFELVKGLTGRGVSFKVIKNNVDYYLVNHKLKEDIKLEQVQENSQFKKDASFEIDNKYSDKPNLFAVRKVVETGIYIGELIKQLKLIMANINELLAIKVLYYLRLYILG